MTFLPYPRRPPNSFHRTHSKFVCVSPPTELTEFTEISGRGYSPTDFTEYTEASGGGYSPTDFTDFHRSRRVWHPCHTHAALRIPSTEPTPSLFAQVLPQNSRNSQKLLAEDILPRISQMYTDFSSPPVVSVCSVNSVGRYFCGCVGMAGMPYPRSPPNSFHRTHSKFVCASPPTEFTEFTEISSGGYSPTEFTEYTEASGVEKPPTDAHRWLGCVGFSHGFHRIHRSFWRRRSSHRCAQMVWMRRVLPQNTQNPQKFLA